MEPVLPAGEEKQQLKSSFERDRNRSPKTRCQAKLHHTHTEIASKERGRQQERCGAQSGAFKSSSETNKWRPTWGLKEYDIKQRTSKGRTFICKTMSRIIHYPELLSYLISFRNYFLSVHGLFGGQVKRQGGGAEGEETRM